MTTANHHAGGWRPGATARRRPGTARASTARALGALAALVVVLVAAVAPAPAQDASQPPSPDLRRPALLSLAGRVVPTDGEPLTGDAEPYLTGPSPESPTVVPPPPLGHGTGALYAVGDSVLLGAESYLRTTLDGWDVRFDAKVSRGVPEGFELVRMNEDRIGDVLILVLGHNYGGGGRFGPWLEALLNEVDDVPRVVLVTVTEWSSAQPEVNRAIRQAPMRHDNVVVADWAAVVAANPGFLRDHVHPNRSGAIALANLIAVMTGPAPTRDGRPPPRPRLLTIPAVSSSGRRTTTTTTGSSSSPSSSSSTTSPSTTATTVAPSSTTSSTTSPSTTATTVAPSSTTSSTPPSSTTTAAPTP